MTPEVQRFITMVPLSALTELFSSSFSLTSQKLVTPKASGIYKNEILSVFFLLFLLETGYML